MASHPRSCGPFTSLVVADLVLSGRHVFLDRCDGAGHHKHRRGRKGLKSWEFLGGLDDEGEKIFREGRRCWLLFFLK